VIVLCRQPTTAAQRGLRQRSLRASTRSSHAVDNFEGRARLAAEVGVGGGVVTMFIFVFLLVFGGGVWWWCWGVVMTVSCRRGCSGLRSRRAGVLDRSVMPFSFQVRSHQTFDGIVAAVGQRTRWWHRMHRVDEGPSSMVCLR